MFQSFKGPQGPKQEETNEQEMLATEPPSLSMGAGFDSAAQETTAVALYHPNANSPIYNFMGNPTNALTTTLFHQFLFGLTTSTGNISLIHRPARISGTIHGMSILHRCRLSSPLSNFRLRKKHVRDIKLLCRRFRNREFSRSGAPKTPWDYAHVLLACRKDLARAKRHVNLLWGPAVMVEREVEEVEEEEGEGEEDDEQQGAVRRNRGRRLTI
ncbi:hypothetical protein F4820DRAFT_441391 [Hypoxylon rubiginosum]|uniref:Uncharacterized protein n=1 Tax=Hypoxylon rubiginosum TaxID=110542 RepID=A0ACB9YIX6_9PEZI|nr:hypothetical protein F4820DRAFT_441391 [Hypoxylon rubiginosum]